MDSVFASGSDEPPEKKARLEEDVDDSEEEEGKFYCLYLLKWVHFYVTFCPFCSGTAFVTS